MIESILLTGGAGYIGSHILMQLLENDYDVVVVDNYCNSSKLCLESVKKLTGKTFSTYEIDILDEEAFEEVFKKHKFKCVIHLAALKSVGESVQMPQLYYQVNVGGLLVLLKLMKKYQMFNLIYSSSATVYGDPKYLPIDEQHPTGNCTNPYGKSKFICEQMLKDLTNEPFNWKIMLLRYFNPVGAHPSGEIGENPKDLPNNIMPYLTQVAVGVLPKVKVFGKDYDTVDGTGVRDYIHIMDLVEGHLSALNAIFKDDAKKFCKSKIFNLGTGCGFSVMQLIKSLEKASGQKIHYEFVGRRDGDIASVFTSTALANQELGWKATRSIDDICRDAWNWQQKYPHGYE